MPVAFDPAGMEQYDERTWFDPRTGDQVSLTYIGLVPDLPAGLDELPLLRHRLALETADVGALIEAHVVRLDAVPTLLQVLKLPIPSQEAGQAFIAAFTVPKATCSAVLRIQCAEGQPTGVREAAVFSQVGTEGFVRPHPYAPALDGRLPWHVGDEARWDAQFPDHPLSRARAWARHTIATARIDPEFARLPAFRPTASVAGVVEPAFGRAADSGYGRPVNGTIGFARPVDSGYGPPVATGTLPVETPDTGYAAPADTGYGQPITSEPVRVEAPDSDHEQSATSDAGPASHTLPTAYTPAAGLASESSTGDVVADPAAAEPRSVVDELTPADFSTGPVEPPEVPARPRRTRRLESASAWQPPPDEPEPEPATLAPDPPTVSAPAPDPLTHHATPEPLTTDPEPRPSAEPEPAAHHTTPEPPLTTAPEPPHSAALEPSTLEPPATSEPSPLAHHTEQLTMEPDRPTTEPEPGVDSAPEHPPVTGPSPFARHTTPEPPLTAEPGPFAPHTVPAAPLTAEPEPEPEAHHSAPEPLTAEPEPLGQHSDSAPEPPSTAPESHAPYAATEPPPTIEPEPLAHRPALEPPATDSAPEPALATEPDLPTADTEPAPPAIEPEPPATTEPEPQPEPARHAAAEDRAVEPDHDAEPVPRFATSVPVPVPPTPRLRAVPPLGESGSHAPATQPRYPVARRLTAVERPVARGDVMHTVLLGLPIGGYLPLWQDDTVSFWRMTDPAAVHRRLGIGVESRSEIDTQRYREAALFSPDRHTLLLMDRYRDDTGTLGGTSTPLVPATKEEAYAAADDKAMSQLYSWLGAVVVSAAEREEFVAVETGGWQAPLTPVVLIMLRTDGQEWHSVVETSPVPVGAPVWRDQQPVEGDTQLLASPATDSTMRAAGLLARFAVATWPVHPFELGLSFGPNPTLGDTATR